MTLNYPAWSGDIHGIVPVVPTPFDKNEDLDLESFRRLIDFAAGAGVTAVCLPAYGSEFYKLSDAERTQLIAAGVEAARGKVRIVAQCNHPSSRLAAESARRSESLGAAVVSFALPRIFALSEDDLLRYAEDVAQAVSVPVLIQDFHPGGASVGASYARRLKEAVPNFRFLKLEEPLMGAKVRAIREATGGAVGVLEGWGGMHLLELLPAGICGAMPGLAMADLFQAVVTKARSGDSAGAAGIFRRMLPFIVYSLQNMELFHHCEKRLLASRGLIRSARVREAGLLLDETASNYVELLSEQVMECLTDSGLSTAPK